MADPIDTHGLPMPPAPAVAILRGRACVRVIEGLDLLLANESDPELILVFRAARKLAVQELRELVATVEPEVTAEILCASETITAHTMDICTN